MVMMRNRHGDRPLRLNESAHGAWRGLGDAVGEIGVDTVCDKAHRGNGANQDGLKVETDPVACIAARPRVV
jgi:hypothetical protein